MKERTRHGKTYDEVLVAIVRAEEKVDTLRKNKADYKEIDKAKLELIQLRHDKDWFELRQYLNKYRGSRIGRGRR